jgi:AcrR family transcriptional regulator
MSLPESATTPRRRGRPRRAETGQAIVDATLALLAECGFQATTVDAIADRAGVAKNTIYRRWDSKDELIADALDQLTRPELDVTESASVYEILREHARDLARVLADPLVRRILPDLLGELQRNRAFAVTFAERLLRPRRTAMVDSLRRAVERGELRRDADVELIADLLGGPPFVRVLLPFDVPQMTEHDADVLVDTIWNGLASPRT